MKDRQVRVVSYVRLSQTSDDTSEQILEQRRRVEDWMGRNGHMTVPPFSGEDRDQKVAR